MLNAHTKAEKQKIIIINSHWDHKNLKALKIIVIIVIMRDDCAITRDASLARPVETGTTERMTIWHICYVMWNRARSALKQPSI